MWNIVKPKTKQKGKAKATKEENVVDDKSHAKRKEKEKKGSRVKIKTTVDESTGKTKSAIHEINKNGFIVKKPGKMDDARSIHQTLSNRADLEEGKVEGATKGKKKRKETVECDVTMKVKKDPNWSPQAVASLEQFLASCNALGQEGLKKQFKSQLAAFSSPSSSSVHWSRNGQKNRHPSIVCLDDTRVAITDDPNFYIHASWAYMDKIDRRYILTQTPLEQTIEDFWKMCFEHKVASIILLCNQREGGKEICSQFWPPNQGDYRTIGSMFISNKKSENMEGEIVYTLEVLPEGCSNSLILRIVQIPHWGAAMTQSTSRKVLRTIRLVAKLDAINMGPVVAMDPTGTGRAAILTLVDFINASLYNGTPSDMAESIRWLRGRRAGAVENEDQYVFIARTVFEYIFRTFGEKYGAQFKQFIPSAADKNLMTVD